jgi:hypothetical protein
MCVIQLSDRVYNVTFPAISEKSSNISRKLLSLSIGVTKVNFMWCAFHNAQWYWSDNLCKLVTDQWQGSLGVHDSVPWVIDILCLFASGAQRNERKEIKISITSGRSPRLSQQRM